MAGSNDLKMCQACRALIPANATQCEMCGAAGHAASRAGSLNDSLGMFGAWPVTMLLITANLAVYALVLYYQSLFPASNPNASSFTFEPRGDIDVLGAFGSISAEVKYTREWWRLLAYCFLHGGVLHIVFNTFGLWQAGRLAEEVWGRAQYLLVYFLSGIGGGLLVMMGSTSAVGASGAIFGLIAGLAVHGYRRGDLFGQALQQYTVSWLLYGLAMSFSPRVSMAGHVGGAIAGAALAWFLPDEDTLRQRLSRFRVANFLAVLMLAAIAFTGVTVARNLKTQREGLKVYQVSRVFLNLADNLAERDRAYVLAGLKLFPQGFNEQERTRLADDFAAIFDESPDTVTPEKLTAKLNDSYQAVCSDIGTLERAFMPDAEIAGIQTQMVTALRQLCAQPALTAQTLNVVTLKQTTDAESPFHQAFVAYWRWVEKRADALQLKPNEILPREWDAFARDRLRRIESRNEQNSETAKPNSE